MNPKLLVASPLAQPTPSQEYDRPMNAVPVLVTGADGYPDVNRSLAAAD